MARHLVYVGSLTIASGGTTSGSIASRLSFGHATDLVIFGPAALTGTVGVEVSWLDSPTGSDWRALKVDGTQITVGAGAAEVLPSTTFPSLRVKSGSSEGADRTFHVMAQVEM